MIEDIIIIIVIDDGFIAAAIDAKVQVSALAHTHLKGQNVFIGIHIGKREASYSSEVSFT